MSFSGNPLAATAGVDINTPWSTVSTLPNPSVHNPVPAREPTGVPVGMHLEPHMPRVTTASTGPVLLPSSAGGPSCSVSMTSSISNPTSTPAVTTSTTDSVVETMTRLLQAQADAMAAQAKAVAVQHLPALPCFTGEGEDATDDGFDKWLERFQERAKYAGWSESDQLYHLKLCLDKTALDVYRMLPDGEKKTIDLAILALRKRFQPGGIEELRGLEFHHLTQGSETIEQLGLRIQQLGRKAFPTIIGKDFDRLLKGRFYQALLVKWQGTLPWFFTLGFLGFPSFLLLITATLLDSAEALYCFSCSSSTLARVYRSWKVRQLWEHLVSFAT